MEKRQQRHIPRKRVPPGDEPTLGISAHLPDFRDVCGRVHERCQSEKDGFWLDHSNQSLSLCSVLLLSRRTLQLEGVVPITGHFKAVRLDSCAFVATRPLVRTANAACKPCLGLLIWFTHSYPPWSLITSLVLFFIHES